MVPAQPLFDVVLRDLEQDRVAARFRIRADTSVDAVRRARARATLAGVPRAHQLDAQVDLVRSACPPPVTVIELPSMEALIDALAGDLELQLTPLERELARLRAARNHRASTRA